MMMMIYVTMILNALTNSSSLWKDLGIHMIQLLTVQKKSQIKYSLN